MKSLNITHNNISDSQLFEGVDTSRFTPNDYINVRKLYNYIVESGEIAKQENIPMDDVLDEGIFGSLVGAISGATIMPVLMKSICQVLGISEKGVLYDLLCSKLVMSALGAKIGYRL